jgi:O-acetyl-ADP-ribose deacetylase (regulator of RNase III)
MIKTVEGDLLKAQVGIIGHQVNCQGVMGSGIAKQIRAKWPAVYSQYYTFVEYYNIYDKHYTPSDSSSLLGKCQIVETKDMLVANLFGQYNYGSDNKLYTSYTALNHSLEKLRDYAEVHKLTIGLPYKIGCDRGGGDWPTVAGYLLELFGNLDLLTLYKMEESK